MRVHDVLDNAVIQVREGMGPAVVAVGVAGGVVGAAYVGVLHVLTHVMGPDHHAAPVQLGIMVAVGAAVALITRTWGKPATPSCSWTTSTSSAARRMCGRFEP